MLVEAVRVLLEARMLVEAVGVRYCKNACKDSRSAYRVHESVLI